MFAFILHLLFLAAGITVIALHFLQKRKGDRSEVYTSEEQDPGQRSQWGTGNPADKLREIFDGLPMGMALIAVALLIMVVNSSVWVNEGNIGLMEQVYFGDPMPEGQVIALEDQKGPKADILMPGYHFIPYIHTVYNISYKKMLEIPEGKVAFLVARDGARELRDGQYLADRWPEGSERDMLRASHFLDPGKGNGQRGPQLNVLKPGKYPVNTFLWDHKFHNVLEVKTGEVAVIRSNILEREPEDCPKSAAEFDGRTNEYAARPIVPKGCIGVWEEPLTTGVYYINRKAKSPTIIPIRMQNLVYKGGYTRREFNLTVNDDGSIAQREESEQVKVPEGAADSAINVRVEGWTVPVEFRINGQVNPSNAPLVVATVGDLRAVEDKVVTPAIRDVLRTIGGNKETKVLDFMNNRKDIVSRVENVVAEEAAKFGFTISEARMGEPAIPPELLVARRREQLAHQLQQTFDQERQSQIERQKAEEAKARANQQKNVVRAEMAAEAAKHERDRKRLQGEGEKLANLERAKGQNAIANVLGKERALQLQMLENILSVAQENPDIIKVPMVNVAGGNGGSAEGSMAVLGALLGRSNLGNTLEKQQQMDGKSGG